ncbi:MAG: nucleotide exchange factor GrpE [Firmicutes bacterium]|jgi:molecular chaperone GrpE|nr:nucleotide exchange factor GrpE [Bacillota bacterium]NBI64311.1 nucleotide exchange factor GrpE [Clostridiales bacterium]
MSNEQKERAENMSEDTREAKADPPEEMAEMPQDAEAEQNSEKTEHDAEASEDVKKEPEEDESSRYMRLMADFQNYKKRVEKEKSDIYSYANEKLATELLAVLDNFERALDHDGEDKSFQEGMEMIFKQLLDVLEKSGLKEILALGEEFDPNYHNAVMTEDTDKYESGKVSGVMQKGYTLNGKVIRPSMVRVAS